MGCPRANCGRRIAVESSTRSKEPVLSRRSVALDRSNGVRRSLALLRTVFPCIVIPALIMLIARLRYFTRLAPTDPS